MELEEFLVAGLLILLLYKPLLWLSEKIILRAIRAWNSIDLDLSTIQIGNVVAGDMAAGDIDKKSSKDRDKKDKKK